MITFILIQSHMQLYLMNFGANFQIKYKFSNFGALNEKEPQHYHQVAQKITQEINNNNFHHVYEICQQEKITLEGIDWGHVFVNSENLEKFLYFIFQNNIVDTVFKSTCDVKVLQGIISKGYTFERPLKAFGMPLSYIISRAQIGGLVDSNRNPTGIWFDEVEMGIESIVYYTKK